MEEGTCPTCGGPLHTCGGCKNCGTCTCETETGGMDEKKPEGDAMASGDASENGGGESTSE